jgi:glucose/arabinose dehydrogenase
MAVTLVTGDDGSNVRVGGPGDDLIYGFNPAGPQGSVTSIAATRVATVPFGPVFAVSPPGDTGRLFIGNLDGTVRILDLTTGQLLPDVFINIGSSIGVIGEGGLIGFAFDPNYASNGYFYVNVTNPSDDTEIRRYQVTATDPNHADPASQTLLLRIDQPDGTTNHKAGWVEFGPDGYLYTALGDGGGGGDPIETGQNIDDLLGNILRLDVHGDDFPADPNRNYAVPADNPFVGTTGADEIWAFGLRNPFRNGFDRGLGDLYIADVGQNSFEEIDFGQKGANYGWDVFEGFMPFEAGPLTGGSAVDPIFAYGRSVGATVIGGYVYRGQSEGLQGEYFFADASNGKVFTLHNNGGSWVSTERTTQITANVGAISSPVAFGQDALGDLYIVDLDGEIFRLTPIVVSADLGDQLDGGGGKDMLFGGSGNDTLHGGAGNDSLYGGKGDDVLAGDGDADFMFGDAGNDTYFVDQAGDAVFERPNEGTDTVVASVSFALGANFENLVLAEGAGPINGAGNAGNNIVTGNTANNTLNGGSGNDTAIGSAGDDTAVFSQNLASYSVQDLGIQVNVSGPDGNDVLISIEHLRFADGTINLDDGSVLFDTLFYLSTYPDVFHAGVDARAHYDAFGFREGRAPNAFFDSSGYLAANPDVAAAGVNPLDHYHLSGWREGRDPSALFDTTLYLIRNPDVAAAGVDPLEHFLAAGRAEGRIAQQAVGPIAGGFDAQFYLFHNPDVAAAKVDPLAHFNQFGWHEGRNPNGWFDTAGYLAHYPDVAAAGVNPLQHYNLFGWREGRDPAAIFDTLGYLAANPDVAAAGVNPLEHFLLFGIYEGRQVVNDGLWQA